MADSELFRRTQVKLKPPRTVICLTPEKTRITHIDEGFDFLGQNIRKYKGKLLIKPSRKNVKAMLGKVRNIIKTSGRMSAGQLIVRLNPILRGWANYHRHAVSKRTFSNVDKAIFNALWRWAKRRHPNKSGKWIKKKYFYSIGRRNRVFCGQIKDNDGKTRQVQLFDIPSVPIKRHIKIKGTERTLMTRPGKSTLKSVLT